MRRCAAIAGRGVYCSVLLGSAVSAAPRPIKGRCSYELKQQLVHARPDERCALRVDVALTAGFSALDEELNQMSQLYGMDLDRHTSRNSRRGSDD